MMKTKDMEQLCNLLLAWKSLLPANSDAMTQCMSVLHDVRSALRDQQRDKERNAS